MQDERPSKIGKVLMIGVVVVVAAMFFADAFITLLD
jgi:hypothetical protein